MSGLQVERNFGECKLHEAVVQERRSHLQRVQHAYSVLLRQNVLRQMVGEVNDCPALQPFGCHLYATLEHGFGNEAPDRLIYQHSVVLGCIKASRKVPKAGVQIGAESLQIVSPVAPVGKNLLAAKATPWRRRSGARP